MRSRTKLVCTVTGLSIAALLLREIQAQVAHPPPSVPPSLGSVAVPKSPDLATFVRDERALEVLGKALFWDMQVGSDGIQSCASCHFTGGADSRIKNQIDPGGNVQPVPTSQRHATRLRNFPS